MMFMNTVDINRLDYLS